MQYPKNREILALNITKERNKFVGERFISGLVKVNGNHPVSICRGAWHPHTCSFLKLYHHIHSSSEKSLIEMTMQYINQRQNRKFRCLFSM